MNEVAKKLIMSAAQSAQYRCIAAMDKSSTFDSHADELQRVSYDGPSKIVAKVLRDAASLKRHYARKAEKRAEQYKAAKSEIESLIVLESPLGSEDEY